MPEVQRAVPKSPPLKTGATEFSSEPPGPLMFKGTVR